MDPISAPPIAGKPTLVGYTIRQHGQTPISLDDTAIVVQPADGAASVRFPGRPEGAPGHHVATVVFPAAGSVRWQVDQGYFAPQDLGTLTVTDGAAEAAGGSGGSSELRGGQWLLRAVLLASTLAGVLASARAFLTGRPPRPEVAT